MTITHEPGALGIGVGEYMEPIRERGETEPIFHSMFWFPFSGEAEATDFALANELHMKRGVAL